MFLCSSQWPQIPSGVDGDYASTNVDRTKSMIEICPPPKLRRYQHCTFVADVSVFSVFDNDEGFTDGRIATLGSGEERQPNPCQTNKNGCCLHVSPLRPIWSGL